MVNRGPGSGCLPVILLLLALALLPALPARADDASLGRVGECVRPIDNDSVIMVAEDITIDAEQGRSTVTCRFTFRNEGPATTVLMGFPEENAPNDREGFADDVAIHDFVATAADRPLVVRKASGVDDKYTVPGATLSWNADWWTFEVPFAAGQERVVVNTYWVKNHQWSNGEARVGYTLVTGRTWKGPIGRIRVRLVPRDWSVADLTRAYPGSYAVDGAGALVWEWENVEPGADISVQFNHRPEILTYRITATDFTGLKADTGEVALYRLRDGKLSVTQPRFTSWPWACGGAVLVALALAAVMLGRKRPVAPR